MESHPCRNQGSARSSTPLRKPGRMSLSPPASREQTRKSFLVPFAAAGVADAIHEVNQWQKHRNDDAANDDRQEDDHDRFEQRSHGGDGIINFFVVVVGYF